MDIDKINQALAVVKIKNLRFRVPGGYTNCTGYALKHPERGYIAFKEDKGIPYMPCGGRTALQAIMDAGGFVSFEGMCFVGSIINVSY